jgi:predicted oxidoreductase
MLGKALSLAPELRAGMEIVSKCGIVCPSHQVNVKHYDLSTNYILGRVNQSLKALGTDYIDLLLIHRPSCLMDADQVIYSTLMRI